MIEFDNVSKTYERTGLTRRVLDRLNFRIEPGESLAICGANGVGKSTLLRLIGGVEHPSEGRIRRSMRTSWPIGYANCFWPTMTGADNTRFIARLYRKDETDVLAFVEDFAQLGLYLNQPVETYSSGMMSRLAFGVSLAIDFDCYLVDEITAAGDIRFRRRSEAELLARRDRATLIMTSHDPHTLELYCKRGAVLYGGVLTFYDTVTEACEVHNALQMRGPAADHLHG
jgi:capsular polysaccharide transport system ATP-binding protein